MSDVQSNNKRIAKNTIILYVRMIMLMLISLYTSRVILDALGVEEYGIFNVVAGVVSMLGFFTSSLSNASQRYINIGIGKKDYELTQHYFRQSFTLLFLFSVVTIILGETVGLWFVMNKLVIPTVRMTAAIWVYQCSLITIFCSINQVNFVATIIANERMNIFAYFALFDACIKLLICYLLNISPIDNLIIYGVLLAIVSVLILVIYIWYCFRQFNICSLKFSWNKHTVKDMLSFISANLFGCFAWSMGIQGTNILLNIFFGPIVNAARGIATQVNSVVSRLTDNVMTAVKPQVIKSYAEGDYSYMLSLVHKSSKYSFYIFALVAFPVLSNTEFLLKLWLKNIPDYSVSFTRLVILETMATVFINPLWIAANATGNIKRNQVYGRLLTLMALPLSYLSLLFIADPNVAVAICTVVQYCYWFYCVYDISMQLKLDIKEYVRKVIYPCFVVFFVLIIVLLIQNTIIQETTFITFAITTVMLLCLGFCVIYLVSDNSERQLFLKMVKKVLKI